MSMQSKSPIIEELEDHMLSLQSHRAQVAAQSSSRNDLEEWPVAQKAVEAAHGVLSRYARLQAWACIPDLQQYIPIQQ